jgi:hypothetical protein
MLPRLRIPRPQRRPWPLFLSPLHLRPVPKARSWRRPCPLIHMPRLPACPPVLRACPTLEPTSRPPTLRRTRRARLGREVYASAARSRVGPTISSASWRIGTSTIPACATGDHHRPFASDRLWRRAPELAQPFRLPPQLIIVYAHRTQQDRGGLSHRVAAGIGRPLSAAANARPEVLSR